MDFIKGTSSKQDVPLPMALVALALVVGGYFYLNSPTTFNQIYVAIDQYSEKRPVFLFWIVASVAINLAGLFSIAGRFFGLQKQGSRLSVLTGKKTGSILETVTVVGIATLISVITYFVLGAFGTPNVDDLSSTTYSLEQTQYFSKLIRLCFSGNVFLGSIALSRLSFLSFISELFLKRLPPFPELEDAVVIGSIDEETPGVRPSWVTLKLKSLFGNLLVTGSIGSGKTAAVILNLLSQTLKNFKIRPSVLSIDPKGTFVPEVLKIIEKHKMTEHVLHLTLGGDVTINPLYQENPLKGARFIEIAQMVKAAAANARSQASASDSEFWEISAFNLTKNSLIYCYAVYGYTTLEDLYRTMVEASERDLKSDLVACLQSDNFDEEEKYNIKCAIQYFDSEYKQLDVKIRTSILATATSFLNQFQEYQANRIFCPPKDSLTLKSIDEVIDQGKILLFDVRNPGLARSMGTFVKLIYEQSVLNRMTDPKRKTGRCSVIVIDEYQDVVSTGTGAVIGDVSFTAKGREANSIFIAATQSYSSLENAIGREKAAHELIQNFRTKICAHSSDLKTIKYIQELAGQHEIKRTSKSVSETSQSPKRNLIFGGFESPDANISESLSTSDHKENIVTGKDFSSLRVFESFAIIFDGIETKFKKLFLKPHFLEKKNVSQNKILAAFGRPIVATFALCILATNSFAFPNVCTVMKTSEFNSCLDFSVGACMCGWPIPRPCAQFSYYVPQTFVEVMPDPKSTYFGDLPGTAIQLGTLGKMGLPYGTESDDDTHAFQAHTITVPLKSIPFNLLPCGDSTIDRFCFEGMSEHLGEHWDTGSKDSLQPKFLAWSLSPKACLLKGAAMSFTGESEGSLYPAPPACSIPMSWMPTFPPSDHSACNGWGTFYPRSGTVAGGSQTVAALMVAARIKSLSTEVFHATPSSSDEKWQMIYPQASSCFREGQNAGILENAKNARELGRITSGKLKGYLFTSWTKVSCCRDLAFIPEAYAALAAMQAVCQGLGDL